MSLYVIICHLKDNLISFSKMNCFKLYRLGEKITGRNVRTCNKSKNPPLDFHSMSNKIIQSSQNQAQGIILLLKQYSTEKNVTS